MESGILSFHRKLYNLLSIFLIFFVLTSGGPNSAKTAMASPCKHFDYPGPFSRQEWDYSHYPEYVCIHGHNAISIWSIWSDVELTIKVEDGKSVKFIDGKSCEEVIEKHTNQSSWIPSLSSWLSATGNGTKTVTVSPYGNHCFAITADGSGGADFSVEVFVRKLRPLYPVMMIIGLLMFFSADELSRNVLFYYSAGVSVGMILSVLLFVFIISRLIPKRTIGYAFLFSGTSLALYILQLTWNQITSEAFEGRGMVISYFTIAGVLSFLYCYYRGPVTSERGFDIMRWCLQSVALFLIYYSIRCEEISLTVVIVLVATRWISSPQIFSHVNLRRWMPYRLQSFFWKPRLITMEEYEREGREETARALNALREYCRSPDCNTWKTVSKLKSPKRFASFVSDGEHITQQEQQEYDEVSFEAVPFLTSDEDSETELAAMDLDFRERSYQENHSD